MKKNLEIDSKNLKLISQINESRQQFIDIFVNAFLAANAPKDFDWTWVTQNVTICMSQVLQNGAMVDKIWIELKPEARTR